MIAANQITLVYHPLSQHDSAGNTRYSTRAATSLACASDLSHLLAYANALWAAEAAGTSGLSDDRLVQVAGSVGIIDPRFARCLREQTYDAWVGKATDAAVTGGYTGAPTILVNGASIAPRGAAPTAAELIAAVAAAPGK
jgi:protein-disulfide isomerase